MARKVFVRRTWTRYYSQEVLPVPLMKVDYLRLGQYLARLSSAHLRGKTSSRLFLLPDGLKSAHGFVDALVKAGLVEIRGSGPMKPEATRPCDQLGWVVVASNSVYFGAFPPGRLFGQPNPGSCLYGEVCGWWLNEDIDPASLEQSCLGYVHPK